MLRFLCFLSLYLTGVCASPIYGPPAYAPLTQAVNYEYVINGYHGGERQSKKESINGGTTIGEYRTLLADGHRQAVTYNIDPRGFFDYRVNVDYDSRKTHTPFDNNYPFFYNQAFPAYYMAPPLPVDNRPVDNRPVDNRVDPVSTIFSPAVKEPALDSNSDSGLSVESGSDEDSSSSEESGSDEDSSSSEESGSDEDSSSSEESGSDEDSSSSEESEEKRRESNNI